ncbi:MAG: med21 domain-containing protein [Methanobacterium sp.]|nr:med21 domain-containing protein [Methanobacterium sp.]
MPDSLKDDTEKDIGRLFQEKDLLEEQIRKLDFEKIERLQKYNEELEKRAEWLDKERIKVIKERDNYRKQVKNFRGRKWFSSLRMVSILAVIDLIILPLLLWLLKIPIQWFFISIGIITFFGILIIANYMSGTSPLNSGEVRKALTSSFVVTYFAFLPLVTFGSVNLPADEPIKTIVTNFTWIVGAIVIFYFGSRALEEYVKTKNQ